MAIFTKKKTTKEAVDVIPEKIHKRLHLAYFLSLCIIGAMIFILFWGALCLLVLDIPKYGSEEAPFLQHEYCGTFFVEINAENSFASQEAYAEYIAGQEPSTEKKPFPTSVAVVTDGLAVVMLLSLLILQKAKKFPKLTDNRYAKTVWIAAAMLLMFKDFFGAMTVMLLMFLFLALRSGDKKTIFSSRASDYFLMGGALWLVGNIIIEIEVFMNTARQGEGMTGIFSEPVYYMQLYRIAVVPVVTICGGLMLRRHELMLKKSDAAVNSKLLKGIGGAILTGAGAFIFYRLGVRIYELVRVMSGDSYTVKLPFTVMDNPYNKLADMPFDMANTPQDYRNAVLFRFVKDFPVFILSAAAVIFFVKVLFKVARGELNTPTNRRYLNISMLLLVAASLWFNLMGLKELDFFNNGFSNIYGEVVYTIALRSMTEPALYALVLWFFKTYLQAIPEAEALPQK